MERTLLIRTLFFGFFFLLFGLGFAHAQTCNVVVEPIDEGIDTADEVCPGSADGWATVSISGGQPNYVYVLEKRTGIFSYVVVDYSPEKAEQTHTFTGIEPGSYRVAVYDSQINDCKEVTSNGFVIGTTGTTPAPITITGETTVCEDQPAVMYEVPLTAGSSYSWTVPAGATIISGATGPENNRIFVNFGSSSGDIGVVETNEGGCSGAPASLAVEVVAKPTIFTLTANGATTFCVGASGPELILSGSESGVSYVLVRDTETAVESMEGTGSSLNFGNHNVAGDYRVLAMKSGLTGCNQVMDGVVSLNPVAAATISEFTIQEVSCANGNDGAINITISGGTAPYSYLWSNNATTEDISNLPAGEYSVTVTDDLGCTVSAAYTVTAPAALDIAETITPVACVDGETGSIDITVSGGTAPYSYLWSTNATTEDISNLSAGEYSVTITDDNGCTLSETYTVPNATPLSIAEEIQNVSCNDGTNGSISLTVSGGTAPYSYLWNTGASSASISDLVAGDYSVTVTDGKGCTATESYTITEPAVLVLSFTKTDATTCGGSEGTIDLSVSGGTAGYSYSWNNGATTEDLSGLAAGTYEVTVTDAQNCTAVLAIEIGEPEGITSLTATTTNVSCFGGTDGEIELAVVGGTAPYSYAWESGQSTASISDLTAGTYTVTVTDATNCTATLAVEVTQPTQLQVDETISNISCAGVEDGAISVVVSGGTADYTYEWSTGETTAAISGLAAGDFSVTVTDANSCSVTETYTLTAPAALGLTLVSQQNVSTCDGTDGAIDISISGGTGAYTYEWSNGAVNEDVSNLAAGTYEVIVTDANGCSLTESFSISAPTGITAINSVIANVKCFGGTDGSIDISVEGGTAPYSYAWESGETTSSISNLAAGTYAVTVTDDNGCTLSASFEVTQPAQLQASLTPTNVSSCGGSDGAIDLLVSGGTAGYTYEWSNGETTEDISGLGAGTYSVVVTDANGCEQTASATITAPEGIQEITNTIKNVSCFGGNTGAIDITIVGGTTPYSYNWDNGATTEDITGLAAGTYTVEVTDATNCKATLAVEITQPAQLQVNETISNISCAGVEDGAISVAVSGGTADYTYEWNTGETTAAIDGLAAGDYSVTVTDANSCSVTETYSITAPAALSLTSTQNNVSSCDGTDGAIDISISGGTAPYSYAWSNGAVSEDISNLAAGTYEVVITDDKGCSLTESFFISAPTGITAINSDIDNVKCFGGTDGSISISVEGGTAPYSYAWESGQTTSAISNLAAGTYAVTVTDDNGCSLSASFEVTAPAQLQVNETISNISCAGVEDGAISVAVSGGTADYTYEWNTGETTAAISGLAVGDYSVTVTDANSCSVTETYTITAPGELHFKLNIQQNVSSCGGADGSIDLEVRGGTMPYTYLWSNNETIEDLANLTAGTYSVTVTDANGCTLSESFTITEPDGITEVTIAEENPISCHGEFDGALKATVNGGTAPYTYEWSNGGTAADNTGLGAGTYELTVTDANGCRFTTGYTLEEPAEMQIESVFTEPDCNGATNGSIDVKVSGATAPYTFLWNTGAETEDLVDIAAGDYELTITDANGCDSTVNYILTAPVVLDLSLNITDASSCNGSDGAISVEVSGGSGDYTYEWSTGETTSAISNLAPGTYSLKVTDAEGCFAVASATVSSPDGFTSLDAVVTDADCNENNGSISLTVNGGTAPYTYAWSNGAETQNLADLAAGIYDVSVTDANGCTIAGSYAVNGGGEFAAEAEVTNASCADGTDGAIDFALSGGTAPYTYAWSTGADTEDITDLARGKYYVVVTDASGCSQVFEYYISSPEPIQLDASSIQQVSCAGGTDGAISLMVSGGSGNYTYTWSDGVETKNRTGLAAGTYEVTVTDSNGCILAETYTINAPEELAVSAELTQASCGEANGAIDLTVTGGTAPYTFLWNTGVETEDIDSLSVGAYTVLITDANACTRESSFTIEGAASLVVEAQITQATCNEDAEGAITLEVSGGTAPYAYSWSNGATTAEISALLPGDYTVTVTDDAGCSVEATYTIEATEGIILTADVTDLSCSGGGNSGAISLNVSGGTGQYTFTWDNGAETEDLTELATGTYTVTVSDGNCSLTQAFTVAPAPALVVNLGEDIVRCSPAEVVLDAGYDPADGYTINWVDLGADTRTVTVTESGNYTVKVTDNESGCEDTDEVLVTLGDSFESSVAIQAANEPGCGTEKLLLEAVVTNYGENPQFSWSLNGVVLEGETGASLSLASYSDQDIITVEVDVDLACAVENTVTASYTIETPALEAPTLTVSDDLICFGSDNPTFTAANLVEGSYVRWYFGSVSDENLVAEGASTYTPDVSEANTYTYFATQTSEACGTSEGTSLSFAISSGTDCDGGGGGNGQNCTTFAANLLQVVEPSCDLENGELHYEISGGTAPYFVRYTFAGQTLEQTKDTETFLLDMVNLPADDTIRIYVQDANGNQCSLKNVLEMAPRISATLTKAEGGDVKCFGEQMGQARLEVHGGNAPFEYKITEEEGWVVLNGTTKDFSNLPAGITSILVRDNEGDDCFASAEVEILSLHPALEITRFETEQANCNDNTGKILVQAIAGGNGGPYKIKLQSEESFRDFDPEVAFEGLSRGLHTVIVTDGTCQITKEIRVGSPGLIAIEFNTIAYDCAKPGLKGGIYAKIQANLTEVDGPYEASVLKKNETGEYIVVPGLEAVRFTQNEMYQYGLDNGTYALEVRAVDREGCPENINGIVLNDAIMPVPITFTHTPQNIYCADEVGTVSITNLSGMANKGYLIRIYSNEQLVKERTIANDEYIVNNGVNGVYQISGLSDGIYRILVSQEQEGCDGLESSEPVSFKIEKKAKMLMAEVVAKTESFPERGSGTLSLAVQTNSGEASYLSSIYLVEPLFPGQAFVSEGDTVKYDPIEATFGLTYTHLPAGRYELYVTDANGCSVMMEETIAYDQRLFIPNLITPNNDGYNEQFYVRNIPETGTRLIITNRWGKVVYQTQNYANDWAGDDLPDGIYFYHLLVVGGEGIDMKGWMEIRRGARP